MARRLQNRWRSLGSDDPESVARRASDARHLEFERRWAASIAQALDNIVKYARSYQGAIVHINGLLEYLDGTQVDATDTDVTDYIKRTRHMLKKYENFANAMDIVAEQAESLGDSFK